MDHGNMSKLEIRAVFPEGDVKIDLLNKLSVVCNNLFPGKVDRPKTSEITSLACN
jgi:hypothetical protein